MASVLLLLTALLSSGPAAADRAGDFAAYLERVAARAEGEGVPAGLVRDALAPLRFDPSVAKLTKAQPEFRLTLKDYVTRRLTPGLVKDGRARFAKQARLATEIERRTGVPGPIPMAIWGIETNYGAQTGRSDILRSLATLGFLGHRAPLFEDQLIAALKLMTAEQLPAKALRGSWAGAVGQVQFMPSSYLAHAVDFDGDGRRDLWDSLPDALGSAAQFLLDNGWQAGRPWGWHVALPEGFDISLDTAPIERWSALGIRTAAGEPIRGTGEATLFFPEGAEGPPFLVTGNYEALKEYNNSDGYVLLLLSLAETLERGRSTIPGGLIGALQMGKADRIEMQERLVKAGYQTRTDGRLTLAARRAIRSFQKDHGLQADGQPDDEVLAALRKVKPTR